MLPIVSPNPRKGKKPVFFLQVKYMHEVSEVNVQLR